MKTTTMIASKFAGLKPALLIAALIAFGSAESLRADTSVKVVPPNSNKYGNDYAGWSAAWWQWAMEQPVEGHPFVDSPDFNVNAGQSGPVWFLAAPFGTVERTCTIPKNKALFIGLLNAEGSDLEGLGTTEAEQRATAKYFADHIVNVACSIDGEAVKRLERFRVASPQFDFTAPTPWIFGAAGGLGTAVADGYYLMLEPLPKGQHIIKYSGDFIFTLAEDGFDLELPLVMTYHLTVE